MPKIGDTVDLFKVRKGQYIQFPANETVYRVVADDTANSNLRYQNGDGKFTEVAFSAGSAVVTVVRKPAPGVITSWPHRNKTGEKK